MGLQVNGTSQAQPMNGVSFGQPTINYYVGTKPGEPDSYQGKTLLGTVTKWGGFAAVVASALLFHRNIGNFIGRKLPSFHKWCGEHIGSHLKNFIGRHPDSWYKKWPLSAKHRLNSWGEKVLKWFTT